MSFYKYIVRILGKPSSYYEMLMNSKKESSSISSLQVEELVTSLKSIAQPCSYYKMPLEFSDASFPVSDQDKWPTDHKLNPLPLIGTFKTDHFDLELFVNQDKVMKNNRYQELRIHNRSNNEDHAFDDLNTHKKNKLPDWHIDTGLSIPIWEEMVHRFPAVNRIIKKAAPTNPWTLFKDASLQLHRPDYKIQLGGYPQWLINDVDFRKIKKLEFLLECKLYQNASLYYFYDSDLKEVFMVKQKL